MEAVTPLLDLQGIGKSFSGLRAVNTVSFSVASGEIVGLIGPNGAGKTTLFNIVAGVFAPDEGRVVFADMDITGMRPDQVCHAGIGRTFQVVKPFKDLSVEDNVVMGALRGTRQVERARAEARELLVRFGLEGKAGQRASSLTLPDRKRLEVARALATKPRLLLLDEVMAGLRPTETDAMIATFRELNRETGLTILLIEHVMRAVMSLSERVGVLHHGELISVGTPEQVVRDPQVLECYLGEEAA